MDERGWGWPDFDRNTSLSSNTARALVNDQRRASTEMMEQIAAEFGLDMYEWPEYRLAKARERLDERKVDFDTAMENLERFDVAIVDAGSVGSAATQRPDTFILERATKALADTVIEDPASAVDVVIESDDGRRLMAIEVKAYTPESESGARELAERVAKLANAYGGRVYIDTSALVQGGATTPEQRRERLTDAAPQLLREARERHEGTARPDAEDALPSTEQPAGSRSGRQAPRARRPRSA
jgi:plasmid maintenance system antidote protein VapI